MSFIHLANGGRLITTRYGVMTYESAWPVKVYECE